MTELCCPLVQRSVMTCPILGVQGVTYMYLLSLSTENIRSQIPRTINTVALHALLELRFLGYLDRKIVSAQEV